MGRLKIKYTKDATVEPPRYYAVENVVDGMNIFYTTKFVGSTITSTKKMQHTRAYDW